VARHNPDDHDAASADPHPPATPAELLHPQPNDPQPNDTQAWHSRRRTRTVIALALVLVADIGLTAGAAITHSHVLGAAAVLLASLFLTVALLNATYRPPPEPQSDQGAPPR
jgi:hypothetical protein